MSEQSTPTAYLVTGEPGVGKTTLIRQVVSTMRLKAAGFYTEDLRTGGVREGFRIVTLDGASALLASTEIESKVQVSKYRVDVQALEDVGVAVLERARERGHVMVIDEIGKMQLYSKRFRSLVLEAVRNGHPVLGTVMQGRNPYAEKIKSQKAVKLLGLTEENRGTVLAELREHFV